MIPDFDAIVWQPDTTWNEVVKRAGECHGDILFIRGEVENVEETGRALQKIALSDVQIGIIAAATVTLFDCFGGVDKRLFSCGRKILSPLGLTAERANRRWGEMIPEKGDPVSVDEAESIWGSAVYVTRAFWDLSKGFDLDFISQHGCELPNVFWDDLCLRARQLGYKVCCTSAVTASVEKSSVTYSTQNQESSSHWRKKWGWDPVVPNIYQLRQKWMGTPLGKSMIDDLFEHWVVAEPMVDVIMMTCDNLPKLRACLENLAKTQYPQAHFHILLNGSGESVRNYLSKLSESGFPFPIDILESPVNLGVPAGLNWLLTRCKAPVIARLDDDVELPEDWLRKMVNTLHRFPLAGAVLPSMVIKMADNKIGILPPLRLYPKMCSGDPSDKMPPPPYQAIYLTNFLVGAVTVYRKKAVDLAGGFDLRFSPTQNEDIDHGMALRAQGYDLIVNGRVSCLHHTRGILGGSYDYYVMCLAQREMFLKKWGRAVAVLESALDWDGRVIES